MKIIDSNTGKRVDNETKEHMKKLKVEDPINREVEKELDTSEYSPMDPPDAYEGALVPEAVGYDDMHAYLQKLMDEHKSGIEKVARFENALQQFKELGYRLNDEINAAFGEFFHYFDEGLMDHNRREERELFPVLQKRLVETGEHGANDDRYTSIDIMEDDHIKFIQLGTLCFNMLGLAARLGDERSRMFVYDLAYDNGRELAEMVRLHIHREDNVLFPLAQKLLKPAEFAAMQAK
jgi:hemerythrin-like domain-containing protein